MDKVRFETGSLWKTGQLPKENKTNFNFILEKKKKNPYRSLICHPVGCWTSHVLCLGWIELLDASQCKYTDAGEVTVLAWLTLQYNLT
jgi:hypothetical protein